MAVHNDEGVLTKGCKTKEDANHHPNVKGNDISNIDFNVDCNLLRDERQHGSHRYRDSSRIPCWRNPHSNKCRNDEKETWCIDSSDVVTDVSEEFHLS